MKLSGRRRCWLAAWLISSLLFSQWAVASYACPSLRQAVMLAAMSSSDGGDADMTDCAAMKASDQDDSAPLMCKAHCEQSQHAFDKSASAGDLSAVSPAALVGVLDWRPVRASLAGPSAAHTQPSNTGPPPGWPPLFLSFLVLRN
jgi:hypothetical protein